MTNSHSLGVTLGQFTKAIKYCRGFYFTCHLLSGKLKLPNLYSENRRRYLIIPSIGFFLTVFILYLVSGAILTQ